ncbi:MAG: hypothetical protein IKE11_08790 [Clostridia bacterium]|nr:hypothetical protein [Clostridia bacterium]
MKKMFKFYLIAWTIMFVLFNIVVVALPKEFTILGVTYEKFAGVSWVTLIVMELCFLLHLALTAVAMKQNRLSGTFYRLPLIRLSYVCVALTLIVASMAMLVFIPSWIPLALALLILAIYAFAILKAGAAAALVEGMDKKVEASTRSMKALYAAVAACADRCADPELKKPVQKLAEALRYADPVSSEATREAENTLRMYLVDLESAVDAANSDKVKSTCAAMTAALADRNRLSKLGK